MKVVASIVLSVFVGALLIGCKSKNDKPQASTNVILQSGTGALLVVFPHDPTISRSNWRTQVTMDGAADTKSLPRIPVADEQAVLVLQIPPGMYKVNASAWPHAQDPLYGGSSSGVEIRAGQMTVVRAKILNNDPYPHPHTQLEFDRMSPWTLASPQKFQDYVAHAVKETVSG